MRASSCRVATPAGRTANLSACGADCQAPRRPVSGRPGRTTGWTRNRGFAKLSFPHGQQRGVGLLTASELLETRARDGQRLSALARMVSNLPELRNAYDALLSGIRLSGSFSSGKSLLVTSTQPNEGKTTVVSCLAITAALSGQAVLLIDGDLRRPSLASIAGIPSDVGLGEILLGQAEISNTIHPVELFEGSRGAGTLSVMGAGGKSPEFLPSVDWSRARTTFQSVSEQFGVVLFDSPPILAANDALLLAGIVDGVLLVVDPGSADRNEVRRAKEQLKAIGAPLIGAVLNQFDPKIHGRAIQPYLGYNADAH
jgi:capsular exopolysaccharide synthesis family protein